MSARVAPTLVSSNVLLAIVNARGVIDAGTVEPFEQELGRAVRAGATKLLVDLTRADEVTTAGMNALLGVRQRLIEAGGQVAVVLSQPICRTFEILGLDRRLLIAGDRTQAARLLGLTAVEPESGALEPRARAA